MLIAYIQRTFELHAAISLQVNAIKLTWIDMDLQVETSLQGCVFSDANIAMEKDLHNTIAAGAKV